MSWPVGPTSFRSTGGRQVVRVRGLLHGGTLSPAQTDVKMAHLTLRCGLGERMASPAPFGELVANPRWFTEPERSEVFVAGYRPMRVAAGVLDAPQIHELGPWVRCVFFHGTMTYYDGGVGQITPLTPDQWQLDFSGAGFRETPPGPHLLLASPSRVDGVEVDEAIYRERIEAARGLLLAFEGRNIAHSQLFEMRTGVSANTYSAVSPTLENPLTFPAPDLSPGRLGLLAKAGSSVASLGAAVRSRIELSLRWYEQGMTSFGVDAFIGLWIAIETLSMPDSTNIGPLVALLARAGGLSESQVRQRYLIGRVFGLRGLIVHNGGRPAIQGALLDFLGAIYADALAEILGTEPAGRIEAVLSQPDFDLRSYLP
jgi:hypothetical protein